MMNFDNKRASIACHAHKIEREQQKIIDRLGLIGFETLQDCLARNLRMRSRLKSEGWTTPGWLGRCRVDRCASDVCLEGCHVAARQRRISILDTAVPIFEKHPGPVYAVTIVHPSWELLPGRLSELNVPRLRQWNARRLASIRVPGLIALGIVEASLNVELDRSIHWAGEIQQVVAGATKGQLKEAFKAIPKRKPRGRPVMVNSVDDLPRKLAYAQKYLVQQRVAFISKINGRQARRHLPPPQPQWAEHDAWVLGMPLGQRAIVYGMARVGQRLFPR